ncbi:MAG: hypothetical protein ACTSVY_10685 [Candidatus Helarchaeota archaeon]
MCANFFTDFYGYLAYQPWLLLLISGVFAGSWFFYQLIAQPEEEEEKPNILKISDLLGMIVGILIVIPAGVTMFFVPNTYNFVIRNFTKILVIVLGMGLFLKPLKDVPWASLLGGIAAIVVLFFLMLLIDTTPLSLITGIPFIANILPWIFLFIFAIIFIFVYLLTKFAGDIMNVIGKLFASKIGSLIVMGIAFIQLILIIIPVDVNGTLTAGVLSIIPW